MIHSKVVAKLLQTKAHNLKKYRKILREVYTRIREQGQPCIIPGYGPAYFNPKNKAKDAIGILTDYNQYILGNLYSLISDDSMKHVVKKISLLFDVNIDTEVEWARFSGFLQKIQDAHDEVFTKDASDIMEFYMRIDDIKKEYKL